MNDFQKRLEEAEAIEIIQEGQDEPAKPWWSEVLGDFVDYLNQKHADEVHACLVGSGVPDAVRLQVSPATRWNTPTTALVLHGSNDRAVVFGQKQLLFNSRAELEDYLLKFVRSSAFRKTLRELSEMNAEDSEGYLRFGGPQDRDPRRDIMVSIPAGVQQRIAKASTRRERIELDEFKAEVLPRNVAAQGKLDSNSPPLWLASGGFLVKLKKTTPLNEKTVLLSGTTVPDEEEDAA